MTEIRLDKIETELRDFKDKDFKEFSQVVIRMAEASEHMSQDLKSLAHDMRLYNDAAANCPVVFNRLDSLERFRDRTENSIGWIVKLIVGVVITALLSLIIVSKTGV